MALTHDEIRDLFNDTGVGWVDRVAGRALDFFVARALYHIAQRTTTTGYIEYPYTAQVSADGLELSWLPDSKYRRDPPQVTEIEASGGQLESFALGDLPIGRLARRFESIDGEWTGWAFVPVPGSDPVLVFARTDRVEDPASLPFRAKGDHYADEAHVESVFGSIFNRGPAWIGPRKSPWLGRLTLRPWGVGPLAITSFWVPTVGGAERVEFGAAGEPAGVPLEMTTEEALAAMTTYVPVPGVELPGFDEVVPWPLMPSFTMEETSGVPAAIEELKLNLDGLRLQYELHGSFGIAPGDIDVQLATTGAQITAPDHLAPTVVANAATTAHMTRMNVPQASVRIAPTP